MKRYDLTIDCHRRFPEITPVTGGDWVKHSEAAAEIAALRERADAATAEREFAVSTLSAQLDAAKARIAALEAQIAGYERRSYGWPVGDPDATYPDPQEYVDGCDYEDGTTFDWEVAAVLRTERYRVVHHRDEEGCVLSVTAELVKDETIGGGA